MEWSMSLTNMEREVLTSLLPMFPHLDKEVIKKSIRHPSNRGEPFNNYMLLNRCIDDLLELRTFTGSAVDVVDLTQDFTPNVQEDLSDEEELQLSTPSPDDQRDTPSADYQIDTPSPDDQIDTPSPTDQRHLATPSPTDQRLLSTPSPTKQQQLSTPSPTDQLSDYEEELQLSAPSPTDQRLLNTPSPTGQRLLDTPSPTDQRLLDTPSPTHQRVLNTASPDDQIGTPSPTDQQLLSTPSPTDQRLFDTPSPTDQRLLNTPSLTDQRLLNTPSPTDQRQLDTPSPNDQWSLPPLSPPSPNDQRQLSTPSPNDHRQRSTPSLSDHRQLTTPSPMSTSDDNFERNDPSPFSTTSSNSTGSHQTTNTTDNFPRADTMSGKNTPGDARVYNGLKADDSGFGSATVSPVVDSTKTPLNSTTQVGNLGSNTAKSKSPKVIDLTSPVNVSVSMDDKFSRKTSHNIIAETKFPSVISSALFGDSEPCAFSSSSSKSVTSSYPASIGKPFPRTKTSQVNNSIFNGNISSMTSTVASGNHKFSSPARSKSSAPSTATCSCADCKDNSATGSSHFKSCIARPTPPSTASVFPGLTSKSLKTVKDTETSTLDATAPAFKPFESRSKSVAAAAISKALQPGGLSGSGNGRKSSLPDAFGIPIFGSFTSAGSKQMNNNDSNLVHTCKKSYSISVVTSKQTNSQSTSNPTSTSSVKSTQNPASKDKPSQNTEVGASIVNKWLAQSKIKPEQKSPNSKERNKNTKRNDNLGPVFGEENDQLVSKPQKEVPVVQEPTSKTKEDLIANIEAFLREPPPRPPHHLGHRRPPPPHAFRGNDLQFGNDPHFEHWGPAFRMGPPRPDHPMAFGNNQQWNHQGPFQQPPHRPKPQHPPVANPHRPKPQHPPVANPHRPKPQHPPVANHNLHRPKPHIPPTQPHAPDPPPPMGAGIFQAPKPPVAPNANGPGNPQNNNQQQQQPQQQQHQQQQQPPGNNKQGGLIILPGAGEQQQQPPGNNLQGGVIFLPGAGEQQQQPPGINLQEGGIGFNLPGAGDVGEVPEEMIFNLTTEVLTLFGEADQDWVRNKVIAFISHGDVVTAVCNHMLENDYPKVVITAPQPSPKKIEPKKVNYFTDYEKADHVDPTAERQSHKLLQNEFRRLSCFTIGAALALFKGHYAPTKLCLEELINKNADVSKAYNSPKSSRYEERRIYVNVTVKENGKDVEKRLKIEVNKTMRGKSFVASKYEPSLQKEIDFFGAQLKCDAEERDRQVALQLNEDQYEQEGQLIECGCCYGDVTFDDMVQCSDGHLFCQSCLQRYTQEATYGEGKAQIVCMTDGCDSIFPRSQLQKALTANDLAKYDDRVGEESLQLADMGDNLVRCPHCNYAALMEPGDKVFQCQAADCKKETCRYCKEDWKDHFGLPCDEIEKKSDTKVRVSYEERMTMAKIRSCHRCKAGFTKSEGCNKMTCRCGAKMCYICRKPDIDYNHFCRHPRDPGHSCKQCSDCSLWSNPEEDDERAVQEIRKQMEDDKKAREKRSASSDNNGPDAKKPRTE